MAGRADKKWYIPLDVNAWISDTCTLTPATRGIWIDALLAMFKADQCGQISGNMATIARICHCSQAEAEAALAELETLKVADLQRDSNGNVTLINRRMAKEYNERKLSRERQLRHREKNRCDNLFESNGNVTVHSNSNSNSNSQQQQLTTEVPTTAPVTPTTAQTKAMEVITTPTPIATEPEKPTAYIEATKAAAAAALLEMGIDERTRTWAEFAKPPETILGAVARMREVRTTQGITNPSAFLKKLLVDGFSTPLAATGSGHGGGGARASPKAVEVPAKKPEVVKRQTEEEKRLIAENDKLEKKKPLAEMLREAAARGRMQGCVR